MKLSFREFRDRFTYLLKGGAPQEGGMTVRSFRAALNNRFVDWLLASRHKINVDIVTELETAKKGDTVEVTITGEDEAAAKTALEAFFKENF